MTALPAPDKDWLDQLLGEEIAKALAEAGISQRGAGRALGVSPSAVNMWIKGSGVAQMHVYAVDHLCGLEPGTIHRRVGQRFAESPSITARYLITPVDLRSRLLTHPLFPVVAA